MSISLALFVSGLQQLAAALTAPLRGVASPMVGPFDPHLLLGVGLLLALSVRVVLRAPAGTDEANLS